MPYNSAYNKEVAQHICGGRFGWRGFWLWVSGWSNQAHSTGVFSCIRLMSGRHRCLQGAPVDASKDGPASAGSGAPGGAPVHRAMVSGLPAQSRAGVRTSHVCPLSRMVHVGLSAGAPRKPVVHDHRFHYIARR